MKVMEALTRLVVGTSRFGDHLLSRKVSGIIVAAFAFACGAGLAHALRGGADAGHAATPTAPTPACAAPAPPAPYVATPTFSVDEEEFGTPELQAWKNANGGAALPLDYDAETSSWGLSGEKVVVLPSGRTLASAGGKLYMLDAAKRVVWKYQVSWKVIDFAHVAATGLVYATGSDNIMVILDASDGGRLYGNARMGGGGYGAVLPYGDDACLVMDALGGYRAGYAGGYEPTHDGVTAWRGTKILWHAAVPPDAELQVVGSKIYAVTKTKDRILVREIKVPKR